MDFMRKTALWEAGLKLLHSYRMWDQLEHFYHVRKYLTEIGWCRSVKEEQSIDRNGNYLPWLTYPAIFFLENRIKPEMTVFEYGSGSSTLWWSERVATVASCEHDLGWYNSVKTKVPSNVEYLYHELVYGGDYSRAILKYNHKFDIVLIDGRDRVNCAKNSLPALKENGVIVWDNSDRSKYQEGYSYLISNGFKRIDFQGLGPSSYKDWCTAIFYRSNNCLDI